MLDSSTMTELSTANSFIVRVYRIDTEDKQYITGLVQPMDGSGASMPFADMDELAAVLRSGADRRIGNRKKLIPNQR